MLIHESGLWIHRAQITKPLKYLMATCCLLIFLLQKLIVRSQNYMCVY